VRKILSPHLQILSVRLLPCEGGGWVGVLKTARCDMFNDSKQKELRKDLRGNLTYPEFVLWQAIRCKALGVKFRRQHGIGRYIVDFYAGEVRLVVELDGESHFSEKGMAADKIRTDFLCDSGMKVIRFTNLQVMQELPEVIEHLISEIARRKTILTF
jgi:very-short-patch-repair endonuclease